MQNLMSLHLLNLIYEVKDRERESLVPSCAKYLVSHNNKIVHAVVLNVNYICDITEY